MANAELIGYSAFDRFEQCYAYSEDACYIADSAESLRRFLKGLMLRAGEYDTKLVTFDELVDDFGCSAGEYALEPAAFARFEKLAKARNVKFAVEIEEEWQGSLIVVRL